MIESRLLRATSIAAVSRMSWLVAPVDAGRRVRRDQARQGAHERDHRVPAGGGVAPERGDVERFGAARGRIASAWATGASPTSASAQVNAASASSIACNHAAPDVASQTGPCASTSSNSPPAAPLRRRRRRSQRFSLEVDIEPIAIVDWHGDQRPQRGASVDSSGSAAFASSSPK